MLRVLLRFSSWLVATGTCEGVDPVQRLMEKLTGELLPVCNVSKGLLNNFLILTRLDDSNNRHL